MLIAAAMVVMLGAVAVMGYLWLKASTDSYDQRYSDCMGIKQAVLYPHGRYWPDNAYNEAMRDCEHKAGLNQTTEHPHPLNETP